MKSARNFQSPYTATSFKDYLAEPSLTLATCWKLTSKNNVTVGATTHTRDLILSSAPLINYALTSNGSTATASSTNVVGGAASVVIDGYRHTNNEGLPRVWVSNSSPSAGSPQWLEVNFGQSRLINRINVIGLTDDADNSYNTDPTLTEIANTFRLIDYKVQYWNGTTWIDISIVTSNDKVWRQFSFNNITTQKIRVLITSVASVNANLVEVEAWLDTTVVYKSSQGIVPTAADTELGLNSAGLEVDSIFAVDVLTDETVAAGDWDGAYFEVFLINYLVPEMGELVMFAGTIGEVKTYGERFRAEGRPLTSKATQQIGGIYTEKCTVRRLGDTQCKINVNVGATATGDGGIVTTTGTVTTGGSNVQFIDSGRGEITGYYTHGTVTFTSGVLSGRSSEIVQHIGTPPQAGGSVVRWGSDSTWKVNPTGPTNWQTTGFDDSSWVASTQQGGIGTAPWLHQVANFPTDSSAQWLWRFFSVNTSDSVGLFSFFRKTFTPNVSSAVVKITADNSFELYVNGTSVGSSNTWNIGQSYNISLNPNVLNSLAVRVQNSAAPINQINPAGLLVDVTFAPYVPAPTGSGSTIQLAIPMPRTIETGTTYTITRGCDREWRTCKNVFGNLVNYRGFPFVPGIERAYRINQ